MGGGPLLLPRGLGAPVTLCCAQTCGGALTGTMADSSGSFWCAPSDRVGAMLTSERQCPVVSGNVGL